METWNLGMVNWPDRPGRGILTMLVTSEILGNKVHMHKLSQQDERHFPTLREVKLSEESTVVK